VGKEYLPGKSAIEFKGLSVEMGGVSILDNINANVPKGKCTAIIGPNGAGKTTLLLALLDEIKYSGNIQFNSTDSLGGVRIGYVPQRFAFDRGIPLTVIEFLSMGVQKKPFWLGISPEMKKKAAGLLFSVKAEHLLKRRLGALSGGEMQRVLLALAIQREPEILVLDEPDSGVDMKGGQVFCELLESLRKASGFTQLMVSHDLGMVAYHASHVICLNRTVIAEGPPNEVFKTDILLNIFGPHIGTLSFQQAPCRISECNEKCCGDNCNV
jgi:zinc transport system ATP-binding protein